LHFFAILTGYFTLGFFGAVIHLFFLF